MRVLPKLIVFPGLRKKSSGESHQSTMIGSGTNKVQGIANPGDKRASAQSEQEGAVEWGWKGSSSCDSEPFSCCSLCL